MKYTNEKVISEFVKGLDNAPLAKMSANAPDPNQRKRMPNLKGDTFTFVVEEGKTPSDYIVPDKSNRWRMVKDKNGKQLSQTALTREGNGLDIAGDTANEALGAFFDKVISAGAKGYTITITNVRVNPSTIEGQSGTKILDFEEVTA